MPSSMSEEVAEIQSVVPTERRAGEIDDRNEHINAAPDI
jgi:hypothetical protein